LRHAGVAVLLDFAGGLYFEMTLYSELGTLDAPIGNREWEMRESH
jgi:hypothetical protein